MPVARWAFNSATMGQRRRCASLRLPVPSDRLSLPCRGSGGSYDHPPRSLVALKVSGITLHIFASLPTLQVARF